MGMVLFIVNIHRPVKFVNQLGLLFFAACTLKVGYTGLAIVDYLPTAPLYAVADRKSVV